MINTIEQEVKTLVDHIGSRLGKGELELPSDEVYGLLLSLQFKVSDSEFEYKQTLQDCVSLLENGYDWNNFYDRDIVQNAKRLGKEST